MPSGKRGEEAKRQSEHFIEAARELGCDEDEAMFEKRLNEVATSPSAKPDKPKHV